MATTPDSPLDHFAAQQARLRGLAYRMLGSMTEADDMLQELYLRWHKADHAEIRTPQAWLVTAMTRLCIDRLRVMKAQRETYIGPWLPEPILTDPAAGPEAEAELASDLSMALLIVLERLAPPERAAFLLHEVFDADYGEIAAALGKSEAACRQIVHRARERVREERPRFVTTPAARARLLARFMDAVRIGDPAGLVGLFTEDIKLWSDGGGKAKAALNVIVGADRVTRFLLGIRNKGALGGEVAPHGVNGELGLVGLIDGKPDFTATFEFAGERLAAIHLVRNPDKLEHVRRALAGNT